MDANAILPSLAFELMIKTNAILPSLALQLMIKMLL